MNSYGTIIVASCILIGLISFVVYFFIKKKEENRFPVVKNGKSIRFHYFVWFFLLPLWISTAIVDVLQFLYLFRIFPYNLIMLLEPLNILLFIVAFIGFFKYTKYSWYCLIIGIFVFLLTRIIADVISLMYGASITPYDIGEYIGAYGARIIVLVYYLKRKALFLKKDTYRMNAEPGVLNIQKDPYMNGVMENRTGDYFQQIAPTIEDEEKTRVLNSVPNTEVRFCHQCGAKLIEGSSYCWKCGTKIGE